MNVIITGATGAIGMALVEELLKQNCNVSVVVRPNSDRLDQIKNHFNCDIILCDIKNLNNLPSLTNKKFDVFYHMAWENTFGQNARNNMQSQIQNIQYTIEAVNAAKNLGCHTFIGTGSQAEYGRTNKPLSATSPTFPENGYGIAKLSAGLMSRIEAKKLGIKHIWARVLSVYGPYDGKQTFISSAISTLLDGKEFNCTKCEQTWDYVYSKDIATALVLLASNEKDGAIYPLGSGYAQSLKKFLETLKDSINPLGVINYGTIPYSETQVMHLCANISSLKEDTGFTPKYTFQKGILKTIKWMKNNK